jgi:hypothetical protein
MCHKSPLGLLPGRLVEIWLELVVIAWGRCGSQLRRFLPLSSRLLDRSLADRGPGMHEVCPTSLGVSVAIWGQQASPRAMVEIS